MWGTSDPRGRSRKPGPALLRSCGQSDGESICGCEWPASTACWDCARVEFRHGRCLSRGGTWPMLLDARAGWGPRTAYHGHGLWRALLLTWAPWKTSPCVWKTPLLSTQDWRYVPPSAVRLRVGRRSGAASTRAELEGGRLLSRGGGPLRDFLWSLPGRACVSSAHLLPRRASRLTLSWLLCSRSLAWRNCERQGAGVCELASKRATEGIRGRTEMRRGFTFSRGSFATPSRRTPSCNCSPSSGCFPSSRVTDPSAERARQTGHFPSKLWTREFHDPRHLTHKLVFWDTSRAKTWIPQFFLKGHCCVPVRCCSAPDPPAVALGAGWAALPLRGDASSSGCGSARPV